MSLNHFETTDPVSYEELSSTERNVISNAARHCHEANRQYCQLLGDNSQVPWEEAPQDIQYSAVLGVMNVFNNPQAQPEDSHENWLRHKAAEGWVYGEVKDPERKTHPCMVPYDQLPVSHRAKDVMFIAVARALLTGYARGAGAKLNVVSH